MNAAVLAEENRTLKATLAQREARIESLEFDLAQLKKLLPSTSLVWFWQLIPAQWERAGVEGHRLASAVFTDRLPEYSPARTLIVDEESSGVRMR